MNEEEITQFQQALENLPQEVKDFLYNGTYDSAIETIAKNHAFSEENTKAFDIALTEVICLLKSKDTLIELFTDWGFDQEKQALLVKDIEEKIFLPIINATNYIVQYDTEEEQKTSGIYEEIQKRFIYGTPIVRPEKKSYRFDKLPTPPRPEGGSPVDSSSTHIDPYRERPE
jgi:hypothetical protein